MEYVVATCGRVQLIGASANNLSNRELSVLICELLAGSVGLKVTEV